MKSPVLYFGVIGFTLIGLNGCSDSAQNKQPLSVTNFAAASSASSVKQDPFSVRAAIDILPHKGEGLIVSVVETRTGISGPPTYAVELSRNVSYRAGKWFSCSFEAAQIDQLINGIQKLSEIRNDISKLPEVKATFRASSRLAIHCEVKEQNNVLTFVWLDDPSGETALKTQTAGLHTNVGDVVAWLRQAKAKIEELQKQ